MKIGKGVKKINDLRIKQIDKSNFLNFFYHLQHMHFIYNSYFYDSILSIVDLQNYLNKVCKIQTFYFVPIFIAQIKVDEYLIGAFTVDPITKNAIEYKIKATTLNDIAITSFDLYNFLIKGEIT